NTYSGTTAINSGTLVLGTGGSLGASSNALTLGTPNTPPSVNPVGALTLASGVSATIGSFTCAPNNTTDTNTLTIGNGATLNVVSNSVLSGLSATLNGAFIVGSPNDAQAITTTLVVSGAGSLVINGGTNNSSFLAGVGNTNTSSRALTGTVDMSGL